MASRRLRQAQLDEAATNDYLTTQMPRHILALLALFSGFLAYGEPARASEVSTWSTQCERGETGAKASTAPAILFAPHAETTVLRDVQSLVVPVRSRVCPSAPTTRIGSDRASE